MKNMWRSATQLTRALPVSLSASNGASSPSSSTTTTTIGAEGMSSQKIMIVSAAAVGSLLLAAALILLVVCMKRRRVSRRIGQLHDFMPSFIDEKAAEEYFKKQSATSTILKPSLPASAFTSVHHRTRSAPTAFLKRVHKHKRSISSAAHTHHNGGYSQGQPLQRADQFQQISLTDETYTESEDEMALKQSLSSSGSKAATAVAIPSPTLHRSISLNQNGSSVGCTNCRTLPIDEEGGQEEGTSDCDALPTAITATTSLRFAEGESLHKPSMSRDYVNPNRFSAGLGCHSHRGSTSSAMEFDPSQFVTTSVMFDASQRHSSSGRSAGGPPIPSSDEDDSEDDDTVSNTSSDDEYHLPPHQMHHNFEFHHPYFGATDRQEPEDDSERDHQVQAQSSTSATIPATAIQLHQALQQQQQQRLNHHVTYTAPTMLTPVRKVEGLAFRTSAPVLPSRIMLPRRHTSQDLNNTAADRFGHEEDDE
ncbi:hypothetical protein EDD11_001244 [Mortierella claussenii]|nr:hypothetical protein EDD11_001244 [Mortierella claussenii]